MTYRHDVSWWHIAMTYAMTYVLMTYHDDIYLERFLICHRVSSPWCRITTYVIRYVIEGGCHHDRHQICHYICHCMSAYVIACHCGFQNVRDDISWWHIMMTYQIWYMSWFRYVIMICHRADMSSWYVIVTFSLPMGLDVMLWVICYKSVICWVFMCMIMWFMDIMLLVW